jgi:hypothetical protein
MREGLGCCLRPVLRPEERCARLDALVGELKMEEGEGVATKDMGPILSK